MVKSYPYNIVLTKDPLVLEKIFFDKIGRTSFSDVFSRLNATEKNEALIVSPRSNNNFISLDVNFPTKASGDGTKFVVLKLLETSKLLEYFNVSTNSFSEVLVNRAKVKKAIGGVASVVGDLGKGLRPRFFLSFGMGDDMREWSGPYSLDLIDANISITSDGVRELELMLTPATESLAVFTNKLFNDYQYGQVESIFDTTSKKDKTIRSTKQYKLAPNGMANAPEDGWNYCIRNIVSTFISDRFPTVPRGNTLVLIPEDFRDIVKTENTMGKTIDVLFGEKLKHLGIDITLDTKEAIKRAATKAGDKAAKAATARFNARMSEARAAQVEQAKKDKDKTEKIINSQSAEIKKINEQIKRIDDHAKHVESQIAAIRARGQYIAESDPEIKKLNRGKNERKKLKASVNKLKAKIVTEALTGLLQTGKTMTDIDRSFARKYDLVDRTEQARKVNSNPDLIAVADIDPGEYKYFTLGMGGTVETKAEEKANTLMVLEPLYKVTQGAYNVSGQTRPQDFTIIEENDTRILKLLKEYGLIDDAESTVIIFGRSSTIEKLVYPVAEGIQGLGIGQAIEGFKNWRSALARAYQQKTINVYSPTPPGKVRKDIYSPRMQMQRELDKAIADEVAFEKELPQHKDSVSRLIASTSNWKEYIKRFVETFKSKDRIRTSSFGEGLGGYSNDILKLADAASTDDALIFTHNIKNSNVLSLSFDSSPYKGELLSYSTESVYKIMDAVFKEGELVKNDAFEIGALAKLIEMAAADIATARKSGKGAVDIMSVLKKTVASRAAGVQLKLIADTGTNVDAGTFFDAVLLKATPYKRSVTQEVGLGQVATEEAETLRKMNKYIINVDIKTLPFFNTPTLPGRKCILFGKPNIIRGADELRGRLDSVPAFYTNAYTILGYKHRITPTDAFSEFKLIQDSYSQGIQLQNVSMSEFFKKEVELAISLAVYGKTPEQVEAARNLSWWAKTKNLVSNMIGSG